MHLLFFQLVAMLCLCCLNDVIQSPLDVNANALQRAAITKHQGGPNVKSHVLATDGMKELRIVFVMKDDGGDAIVDIAIKGDWVERIFTRTRFQVLVKPAIRPNGPSCIVLFLSPKFVPSNDSPSHSFVPYLCLLLSWQDLMAPAG